MFDVQVVLVIHREMVMYLCQKKRSSVFLSSEFLGSVPTLIKFQVLPRKDKHLALVGIHYSKRPCL